MSEGLVTRSSNACSRPSLPASSEILRAFATEKTVITSGCISRISRTSLLGVCTR